MVGFSFFLSVSNQPFGLPDEDYLTDPDDPDALPDDATETKRLIHQKKLFINATKTESTHPAKMMEVLFFALFGVTDYDDAQISQFIMPWSSLLIKFIFAIYLTMSIIVLINLLIAMMSDTYCRIQEQVKLS